MKTLYLECNMGAAGDMLTAALLDLTDREAFLAKMSSLGLPGTEISADIVSKCGISGLQMSVRIRGEEEESHDVHEHEHHHHEHEHEHHHHEHEHEHHHEHHHSHTSMHDITHLIQSLGLSEKVKSDALAVYGLIAEAESHAHGRPVSEIHFHEVGTMDAVADIVGVCLLMEMLAPDKVIVSPVNTGSGQVRCAHGILPVPAPAAEYILRGIPAYSSGVKGELCTPTGAALLRHFADGFGSMPVMRTEKTGYGFGKKEFEQLNCVRAFLGETGSGTDTVYELKCNLDDMTPEDVGFAAEELMKAGALDVFTSPVYMKKDRPAVLLTVLCREADRERLVTGIFRLTSTIGIRQTVCERYVLDRKESVRQTVYGEVRVKEVSGCGVSRCKPEADDIARIAKEQGLSPAEIRRIIGS